MQGISDSAAILDKSRSGAPPKITPSIGAAMIKFTEGKVNIARRLLYGHTFMIGLGLICQQDTFKFI